ncbi:MAG: DNA mismatch repair protein MutS [Oscillospiraceae bacterium]|nr:DNA mismatch repair protein MutS [Oscillospiraceae bacterium]
MTKYDMSKMSPMMKQYWQIKERHKDCILFFRLGDFFELFFDDAVLVSELLQLTLTKRDSGGGERAPMCGVPHHACDNYIRRLVSQGYKIAICDQMAVDSDYKGLAPREVIQIVTPGTIVDGQLLEETVNNYICCICVDNRDFGIGFCDITTGVVRLSQFGSCANLAGSIINELSKFTPSEILFSGGLLSVTEAGSYIKDRLGCACELIDDDKLAIDYYTPIIENHFGRSKKELGLDKIELAASCLGVILDYLNFTQRASVKRIINLDIYKENQFLGLDMTAIRNLEITVSMGGDKKGSLLWAADRAKTPMGRRLIRQNLLCPLVDIGVIRQRQDGVEELLGSTVAREEMRRLMSGIKDIERLITKVMYNKITPQELLTLSAALGRLPEIKGHMSGFGSAILRAIDGRIHPLSHLYSLIEKAIEPDREKKTVIREGYNNELDDLRRLSRDGQEEIRKIAEKEKESAGLKSLRSGYNRVFGYYLEVGNGSLGDVPDHFIRKQTLTSCERFITPELKEIEEKVLNAGDRYDRMEDEIFSQIKEFVAGEAPRLQETSDAVSQLDMLCGFAALSAENNYTKPVMVTTGSINIKDGRHPVVEQLVSIPFVPNDTLMDGGSNKINIITGPNMAGKSTYMKQVALICLLAQTGCFVPASYAELPVVDNIFTRVGAADDTVGGRSTFMVEMSEVAYILDRMTPHSLLILDEIGRGTSTYDGMSIAKAVVEYVAGNLLSGITLFSTHYHELTDMEDVFSNIKNLSAVVKRRSDDIIFLRKVIPGRASGSYGIDVARYAGVPDSVVERAKEILLSLEKDGHVIVKRESPAEQEHSGTEKEIAQMLRNIHPDTLTPIEALGLLYEMRKAIDNAE